MSEEPEVIQLSCSWCGKDERVFKVPYTTDIVICKNCKSCYDDDEAPA